jgi:hypothetical protein
MEIEFRMVINIISVPRWENTFASVSAKDPVVKYDPDLSGRCRPPSSP